MRLQEQNTKAAQQWIAASMKVAQLQQRSVRFAQEWLHHGAEAPREQTEEATREAELRASVIGALGLDDYDGLNVAEVTEKLDELSVEELERLRELEKRTEDRESLVKRIDRKIRTNSQGKTLPYSTVEGRGLSPSPSTCCPRIRSLSSPLRGEAWKG